MKNDKKLQKEILTVIKNSNENPEKGVNFNLIKNELSQLVRRGCYMEDIKRNFHMLSDKNKIEVSDDFFSDDFYGVNKSGWARLTVNGYKEFDPW